MDFINTKLLLVAKTENITPRDKSQGVWLSTLLPLSVILSQYKYHLESSPTFKLQSSVCFSLLLSSILFILSSCRNNSVNTLKIVASVFTTIYIILNGNVHNIFIVGGISFIILSYEQWLLYIMRECPRTFTFGEASFLLQGIILFITGILLKIFIPESNGNLQIATVIVQMGLLTLLLQSLLTFKYKYFHRPIPFYLLLSVLSSIFLIVVLYGLIKQNAFVWIFHLFTQSDRRVYLVLYWVSSVFIAMLAIRWQICRARKATTVSRKIFHILAVMVYMPGLLYECTIIYLASGVVFGILIFIELLRILSIPPFGNSLQEIFVVYSDDKDQGMFSLTQLYLMVGCSLPLWIHPALCDVTDSSGVYLLPLLSGLLCIGVGDTGASAIGVTCGLHTWAGTRKTVEGTLGCILSQLLFFGVLYQFDFLIGVTRLQVYKVIGTIILTSLVEAKTSQVDNLALPLIMYILLIL